MVGRIVGGGVLVLGLGAGALFGARWAARRREAPAAPVAAAAAGKPQAVLRISERPADDGFLGVVLTGESVDLAAKFPGKLEAVHVQVGDRVTHGQPLARLDMRSLKDDLAMAEAGLHAAVAEEHKSSLELSQARERHARRAPLADSGGISAISPEELSNSHYQKQLAATHVESAKAAVLEKRARVDQLKAALADAEIRAPFDGVVAARMLDPGAVVAAGTPIVHLISEGELRVRFAVPEEQKARIAVGVPVRVQIKSMNMALGGSIQHIAPEVDTAAGMIFVLATLDAPQTLRTRLSSGVPARVSVAEVHHE